MSDTKIRKEIFFNELNLFLKDEGFSYKKSKNSFVKNEEYGTLEIGWDCAIYFHSVDLFANIYLKDVENLKKKAWGDLYRKYSTLGNNKYYLSGEKPFIETGSLEEVKIAIDTEIRFYKSFLKSYFSKYSNLLVINQNLISEFEKGNIMNYNVIQTIFTGMVISALIDNRTDFINKMSFFRKKMDDISWKQEFEILESYLLNNVVKL